MIAAGGGPIPLLDLPTLAGKFTAVRQATQDLISPLDAEDCVVQSMPDASPTKWHLAHTTWFFETFIVRAIRPGRAPFKPGYDFMFNSYYNKVGEQQSRPRRGMLTRPGLEEVLDYRAYVETELSGLFSGGTIDPNLSMLIETGLQHEQQHQELLLTDIKHLLSCNPLMPAYDGSRGAGSSRSGKATERTWIEIEGGIRKIGAKGGGFSFDNERPRHKVYLGPFALASRPATNGEYLKFMEDGGYQRSEFWLADGWDHIRREGWQAPLYWTRSEGGWVEFTLRGARELRPDEPVAHVSYYEADAFARWSEARLPTEAEWETAASSMTSTGNFLESGKLHPEPCTESAEARSSQLFGNVWEWTRSAYGPYPGFQPPAGALGEYNGKFMCNQMVLRGGSCVTPRSHIRASYRNFLYPSARWQFSGVRLARELK
jgi:ergothioneine biosynthesis protein EgtB